MGFRPISSPKAFPKTEWFAFLSEAVPSSEPYSEWFENGCHPIGHDLDYLRCRSVGGEKDFGRLGLKTLLFYSLTGLLAVITGLSCVNLFSPGIVEPEIQAQILANQPQGENGKIEGAIDNANRGMKSLLEIFHRMVPVNLFKAAVEGQLLGLIFFSLLFGFFISKLPLRRATNKPTFGKA